MTTLGIHGGTRRTDTSSPQGPAGYLTGIDILVDGGVLAAVRTADGAWPASGE